MATVAGARAAGLEHRIGRLEPGKRADIVIHTLDRPEMVPLTDMIRNLVYASRSRSVHTVIIDGKIVLEDGRFPHLDERRLLAEIRAAAAGLFRRMGHQVEPNEVAPWTLR
jgi:cytosine/adenosine deaminase-related metal-dependent hydrolase